MHVLLLDSDYSNALTRALQLSGYGMIVETAQDIDAALCRLSTMQFDVVLVNVDPADDRKRSAVKRLQKTYPNTVFFSHQRIDDFFESVGIHEGR
jgi:CheY-like chemotaxis protein